MDFEFTEEEKQFRREVCDFLTTEISPQVVAQNRDSKEWSLWSPEFTKVFLKKLAAKGLIGVNWPKEYGGGGKPMIYEVILREEMDYHRAPVLGSTMHYIPPIIIRFGSEEQKKFFLPRIRIGEIVFFLGYSEPEAGSDLANLQMRAIPEGDNFIINGEKIFSSFATLADYGWIAARTDISVPKHKGISLFIVDMKSPGISITGHTTISDWIQHSVSFQDVRVPKANLVGELNRGWEIVMSAIDYERATLGNAGTVLANFDRLVTYCKETKRDGCPLSSDPIVRRELASLAVDVEAARLISYWIGSIYTEGYPRCESAMGLLFRRETLRQIDNAHAEILGLYTQLKSGSKWAPLNGAAEHDYIDNLYFHFAVGGFDITRNIIATRGLGLPR